MTEESPSAWALLPLPGQSTAAAYLTGPLAKQYRLIVDILDDERHVSLTGVGFDELSVLIRRRLPDERTGELMAEFALEARMRQLVEWGTCESWQDHAETQQDFLRNRFRYQLTEAGSAFNAAVRRVEAELGPSSTAVLLAPASLTERLNATLAAIDAGDPAAASKELAQAQTTLDAMGAAASEWQSRLAAALGGSPTEQKIQRLLETILAYVEAWGSGVDAWSDAILGALPRLGEIADDTWRAMALARLGSDAPESSLATTVTEMRRAVTTVGTWFAGTEPQAKRLRRRIRDAVAPVLRSHRTLLAVGGTVSRKADLLRLASAMERAPDGVEAWRLWCTATGLFPARHFTLTTPEVSNGPRVSAWEAPPAVISRRLRAQASRSLAGRPAQIVDNVAARVEARRLALREQADLERAAASLTARSGTALSHWADLTATESVLLLALISAARDQRTPGGPSSAVSADGRWRLVLHPRPGSAVLNTPDGRLVLPDALVEFGP